MKIGFIGCGKMAAKMAIILHGLDDFELVACAARDENRAIEFKNAYHFKKAYASYEELVKDKDLDLIYISVVTKAHFETMKLCIDNHKNVVCEKPFTLNSVESKKIIDLAKKNKVFLSECMWTRFMPIKDEVLKIIKSGEIGKPYLYSANIGYAINMRARMQDSLGGGVLLDCGVYPLNFVLMYASAKVKSICANAILTPSGVDDEDFIHLKLNDDSDAIVINSMKSNIDCSAYIYGDNGYIKFDHVNHPYKIDVYSNDRPPKIIDTIENHPEHDGYEFQWFEFEECINKGMHESVSMPLKETQYVMELLDDIRKKANIKFSNEK